MEQVSRNETSSCCLHTCLHLDYILAVLLRPANVESGTLLLDTELQILLEPTHEQHTIGEICPQFAPFPEMQDCCAHFHHHILSSETS